MVCARHHRSRANRKNLLDNAIQVVAHLGMEKAQHTPAVRDESVLALPVRLEGGLAAVILETVELDDDLRLLEHDVGAVASARHQAGDLGLDGRITQSGAQCVGEALLRVEGVAPGALRRLQAELASCCRGQAGTAT